jgi:hypothetical protein
MNTFALDKNYDQINFEKISVAELEVISGGSGGGCWPDPNLPFPMPGPFPGPYPSPFPGPTFPDPGYAGGGGSWG